MEMGLLTRMRTRSAFLGALVAISAGCSSTPDGRTASGGVDPDRLRVTDMDARPHDLASEIQAGYAVALVFWSPWCEGCKEEAPGISAAEKAHRQKIRFYGVVPGPEETVGDDEIRKTAAAFPYEFPQVRDRDLALTRLFDVVATPTIIVLGPGPAVRYQEHAPPADWSAVHSR